MGGEDVLIRQGRSLVETPTYSVATVITVLVFVCFLFQRSIYRFGKWLEKTRRKALFVSLEKIKEELMLLGLISLLLAQCARSISEICVNSSLFSSKFYLCSEEDYGITQKVLFENPSPFLNESHIPPKRITTQISHQCGEGREPFVSLEGLEQLHRFLFVLGITHVLYSCLTVGLAMSKIYSWRKWENQTNLVADGNLQAKKNKVMRRQSTFVFHHTSHPWSRSRVLIWMKHKLPISYDFHKYMVRSMEDEFHGILGISWPLWGYAIICIFINIHGLNIYFWLSFIPAILVMLVGTKLQHVVSTLALEIGEQTGPSIGNQVKPRDGLFWFGKPDISLRLIQFIIFQNAFEMATFIWSLWGFKKRSCFMKNHLMIIARLASGVLVQIWCSYSTVPLNVIITQMGSRFRKALVAESVRDSLHSWCKRVKERSKRDSAALSVATRSVCSLDTTIDEQDEITVASGTLSRSSSLGSLNEVTVAPPHEQEEAEEDAETSNPHQDHHQLSLRIEEYLNDTTLQPPPIIDEEDDDLGDEEGSRAETLIELFQRT
ncbi:MLO-like protein 4 isoform X2 [Populus trichocarpa]|uniref:MLO-like protein n=1 Tax=Populus trichocarpa TaxID=3694 RepID=A0A3N7EYW4_POPTR|nr:MLO-like protein 4 isoform X2 [Populus trichocarpa]|eukprot:XP_024454638.1 MLO-like protein 4 isoform X2 [Populus trichocarpa]